jgi:hypothetical protein
MGKRVYVAAVMGLAAAGMCGCHSTSELDRRYPTDRAALPEEPLPNPPRYAPAPHVDVTEPEPTATSPAPEQAPVITGTWTFTTPPTVTRLMKKTGEMMQYSLYAGRPAANDTPIVVITVGPPEQVGRSVAESDPATYKVTGTRSYTLNGNIAREWTGTTSTGSAFSELELSRPGASETSDVCHVMATARNTAERTTALEILKSVTWGPAGSE